MFGGIQIKLIIFGLILAFGIGLYFYIQSLRSENARLIQNQTVLEDIIQSKDQEIKKQKEDFIKQNKALKTLQSKNIESDKRISDLLQVLGDGRLGRLAKKKPGLIQNKINKANKKWNEEIRKLTDPNTYDEE